jgi:hypothetical protein
MPARGTTIVGFLFSERVPGTCTFSCNLMPFAVKIFGFHMEFSRAPFSGRLPTFESRWFATLQQRLES